MTRYDFSDEASRIVRSEIREILAWSRRADTISFGGGLPDPSLFPVADLERISAQVLRKKGYLALQYGPTQGEPEALESYSRYMAAFGDKADPGSLCSVSSSQQALDLLTLLFLDAGAPVVVEVPSYVGALQAFGRAGADLRGVPMGREGMDLDALEEVLRKLDREGKRPRFLYAIPDFQNPSGVTLSLAGRRRLLAIAGERGLPIVEDSPYRELSFGVESLPSLWTLAGGRGVILLKTLSKMLFPGFRLGWMAAEEAVINKIVGLKQSVDLCTSSFLQLVTAAYFDAGLMEGTLARARALYAPKRDAMVEALARELPPGSTWTRPEGGVFCWAALPPEYDSREVLKAALDEGVAFVIGKAFHCDGGGRSSLRLNYSFPSIEAIREGGARLGRAVRKVGGRGSEESPARRADAAEAPEARRS